MRLTDFPQISDAKIHR